MRKLCEQGFAVGDYITYHDNVDAHGTIYMISEDHEPLLPEGKSIHEYNLERSRDRKKNRKKIPVYKLVGGIRIEPMFSFFGSNRSMQTMGKRSTFIIYCNDIVRRQCIKPVDLVGLCTKYSELGLLINDIVKKGEGDVRG